MNVVSGWQMRSCIRLGSIPIRRDSIDFTRPARNARPLLHTRNSPAQRRATLSMPVPCRRGRLRPSQPRPLIDTSLTRFEIRQVGRRRVQVAHDMARNAARYRYALPAWFTSALQQTPTDTGDINL